MQTNIEVVEPKLYDAVVADEICAIVNEAVSDRGVCSVVLAGGSTPGSVYRLLSRPPRVDDLPWSKMRLILGDERWVPLEDNQSNARMVHDTLLAPLGGKAPELCRVDTSLKAPQVGAQAYEQAIRKVEGIEVKRSDGSDMLVFDLVLLGMGEDGHTASLFPGEPLLSALASVQALECEELRGRVCVAVSHPEGASSGVVAERISLTPAALFSARRVLFLVRGEGKAEMLKLVVEGDAAIDVLPSRLYTRALGRVTWFVDSPAAAMLSSVR